MGKIQFKNVNKIYPNGFHAIHDFNLTIDEGEFIVFVGPSGCGKSTVLRMLGGLEQISSGEVILDGKVVNKCPPVERDIAIVFQDYALYSNMSVYENVGISMKVQHEKDTVILDKVLEQMADGPQTRGGPIGTIERTKTSVQSMRMPGTPAIQKPMPATTAWPSAVPTRPKTTERVVLTRIFVSSFERSPETRFIRACTRSANQAPSR